MCPVAFMRSVGGGTNCESTAEALANNRNTRECENMAEVNVDCKERIENEWGESWTTLCYQYLKLTTHRASRCRDELLLICRSCCILTAGELGA